jgi:hypothetical protein
MATFDPSKSASANYLRGLQAARRAVGTNGGRSKVQPLISAHLERDRSNEKPKTAAEKKLKKASLKKPGK